MPRASIEFVGGNGGFGRGGSDGLAMVVVVVAAAVVVVAVTLC